MTSKFFSNFDLSLSKEGISLIQGAHHVAQKLTNNTLPLNSENEISFS